MDEPIFHCTQEEEILTARTCWQSCKAQQLIFFDFSPRYTLLYIDGKLAAIDDAEALPTEEQRQEAESTARIELVNINKDDCALWQKLKRYIAKAYAEDLHQAKWNAAGMADYEEARNDNWESAGKLMRLGNDFITNNLAALTAHDNMPAAFAITFRNAKTAFDLKLKEFVTAEQTNTTGAETRVKALNAVHTDLMEMDLDGQEIFIDNDAIKKQFVYEQVLRLYAGNGAQGYKGKVTNEATGAGIEGVRLSVGGTVHSTHTDGEGNYAMRNVAHGDNQTVTAECDGFVTRVMEGNDVEVGVMTTLDIVMVANP